MKQTNDLMHYGLNGQPDTTATIGNDYCQRQNRRYYLTSFTSQILLVLALIMGSGSHAEAEELQIWGTANSWTQTTIPGSAFQGKISDGTILRIYMADAQININSNNTNIFSDLGSGDYIPQGSKYYDNTESCFKFVIQQQYISSIETYGITFTAGSQVSKVTLETSGGGGSSFINSSSPDAKGTGTKEIADDTTHPSWESFSLAELNTNNTGATAFGSLSDIRYIRVYVKEGNNAVDYNSHVNSQTADLLQVTAGTGITVAPAAKAGETADPKDGLNIYNGGTVLSLNDITVTLNAGDNHLKDYKLVVLLSTSDLTNEGNEPTWDFEYTYSFTYPTSTKEIVLTEPTPGAIPMTALTEQSYAINIQSNIRDEFPEKFTDNTDEGANLFMQSWTGKWYITDSNGNKQPLAQGNGANGSWSDGGKSYNGWSLVNNELSCSSTNNTNGWYFAQQVGNLTVYAPSGETLGDYMGYRVVFEVSDANPVDEPKVRFILPIPTGVVFEYDGIIDSSSPITQELSSRTATSVTLNWTNMTTTGVKYARFFVVDGNGDAVDASSLLSVNGGTLCDNPASGYYVYPGSDGNIDFSNLSVTLSASSTAALLGYKVKCWLATSEDNINHDGNTVTEEPDITNEYVYSFVKPAPTTVEKTGTIAWEASMQADASDGAPADWDTTWDELSREQRVVWYVTDGTTKQALALGTAAQTNTWTLNLPNVFSVSSNEAVLTGQASFTATEWATWGQPGVYAPTGMTFADGRSYQVVCEVYETATGTTPNVRYTFSFTKDFLGELKSGVTPTTLTETLDNATDVSCTLSNVTIPSGTKYVRFYLTDTSDLPVDPMGKLTVSGTTSTVSDHPEYGYYIYNESGIDAPTVTLALTDATLNQYCVVMVTSADNAVTESGTVVNEPDYDTQTTWSFKYPVQHTEATADVEWSPASIAVPLDIDALKGSGYLASLGSNYHVVWTVEDGSGTAQTLTTGTSRQNGAWAYSVDGDNATFYAPSDATFTDVQGFRFVARLYETATGESDADKSLTYTASIVKTGFFGELKDPTAKGSTTIILNEESTIPVSVPLGNATTAFATAKYARVWLTQGGTLVAPTGKLTVTGMTTFGTNHDATYGYYLYDENGGISLSDATLTLAALADYPQYQVHVALSADAPISYTNFARATGPRRAPADAYEPDYDFEYTISFQNNSMKVIKIYVQADDGTQHGNDYTTNFQSQIEAAFAELGITLDANTTFTKWDLRSNGSLVTLNHDYAAPNTVQISHGDHYLFNHYRNDNEQFGYYSGGNQLPLASNLNAVISFGNGVFQLGSVLECWVTNVNSRTNEDPADGYKVKVEVHFNEDGNPPYTFVNETDIAADKVVVPVTAFKSADCVLDLTDALAANAKYVRVYLTKQGGYDEASENLQITYDGGSSDVVQCERTKYGYYLSLAEGIDVSKLHVRVNLTPDEMLKYNVVMVSADSPLTGAQEPTWQKKRVYTFQKEIFRQVMADMANNEQMSIPAFNLQSDILARLDAQVSDFSKTFYGRWYVIDKNGVKQPVTGGNGSNSPSWSFDIRWSGLGSWQNVDNVLRFYTGMEYDNNGTTFTVTPAYIESADGWAAQVAEVGGIHVPQSSSLNNYVNWSVVFEFCDEYAPSSDTDPDYKLRYVVTISDPTAFEGTGPAGDEHVQEVNRNAPSVNVALAPSLAHSTLSGDVKYARYYLTDAQGNAIDPTGLLTVSYDGGTVTTCNVPEHGFYIYPGDDQPIDKTKITVTLTAPKAYRCYQVVGLYSTELLSMIPDDYTTPLSREPNWEQRCTYTFRYPTPATKEIEITIPWSKTGMKLDASTTDVETDWGISFEELAAGQNVRWYVERRGPGNQIQRQQLIAGTGRNADVWTVKVASAYNVNEATDEALLTGRADFTDANWNSMWSSPTFYPPTNFQPRGPEFNECRLVCEVATSDEPNAPYVRYSFKMEKFLGDLEDDCVEGNETIIIKDKSTTEYAVPLDNIYDALNIPADKKVVYARVWLTKTDGTPVAPEDKLSWSQMFNGHNQVHVFPDDKNIYGWYFCSADIGEHHSGMTHGELGSGTLTLPVGHFTQYQVHVALSTSNPTGMRWNNVSSSWEYANGHVGNNEQNALEGDPSEPDYDYVYTFNFDYGFEADNINTVKTKYKTAIYDETTRQFKPSLFQNWLEVSADCEVTKDVLANNGYARWYLEDLDGKRIQIEELTSNQPYTSLNNDYGFYRYKFDVSRFSDNRGLADTGYDPTITLPDGYNYDEVRLVCVVTTKTTPQTEDPSVPVDIPAQEPSQLQVKYIYNLEPRSDYVNLPFIHYQGEAYKYLVQMGKTDEATERDYITVDGDPGTQEQSWDFENSVSEEVSGNIRQNVHTVDYYVYIDPADAQGKELMLPSQLYFGDGNDTEPRAYYRWYDWQTDMKANCLSIHGSELHLYPNQPELTEEQVGNPSRGFFGMLLSGKGAMNPCDGNIGVRFNAPAGWNSESDEIVVACDVSRYLDGMDDSFTYLVHEPTLSVRYIYHILPAQKIADGIADAALDQTVGNATGLEAVEANLKAGMDTELYEYNGRTVLSLNGTTGAFTMRSDLQQLSSYWIWADDSRTTLVNCTKLQWYAYYLDEDGKLWKHTVGMNGRENNRLGRYELTDLSGYYTEVGGSGATVEKTIQPGDRLYMIGCMGNGTVEAPVVWDEFNFIDARPLLIGTEGKVLERTDQYMRAEHTLAQVLDFNSFFDEDIRFNKPTSSNENYATVPIIFPDAQYGFCYPQLYGLCGSNKFASWGVYGISPTHGDYTLLKSMNMPGVSQDANFENQSIGSQWWWGEQLYDVTHTRAANGNVVTETNDYGTFLYVDASDEARVIAELEFDAALCADAEIYYTAYVADMTDNVTRPQVRFRVTTEVDGKRVPVVTFETGDIVSEGATTGFWHQVYGHTMLPARLHHILNGTTRHYYVSVENSCENTNGADYCVDQISFYTHQANVKAKIVSDLCDEGDVKVKIIAEADQLLKSLRDLSPSSATTKEIFYCVIERSVDLNHELHAEDILTGNGFYTDQNGNNNNEYGVVSVPLDQDLLTQATELHDGTKANTGFYYDADMGVVYFQLDEREFHLEPGKKYFVSIYDMAETRVGHITGWGTPYSGNACSVYSNDVSPNRMFLDFSIDGQSTDGHIEFGCNATTVTKKFDIAINYPSGDGYDKYTFFKYDFFELAPGKTKADFMAIKDDNNDDNPDNDIYLTEALEVFRQWMVYDQAERPDSEKDYAVPGSVYDELPRPGEDDIEHMRMYNLIKKYMDGDDEEGTLYLSASSSIERTFTEAGIYKYLAIPLTKEIPTGGEVCSPIEFEFNVDEGYGGPVIELGFDDVEYPADYTRTVRVGLEQLSKMITKTETVRNYMLHIPISSYHNKGQGMRGRLYFQNTVLSLFKTNDPSIETDDNLSPTTSYKVAEIKLPEEISSGRTYVGPDRMYLPVDFSECAITFHEGYWYEVSTSFIDEEDDGAADPCVGDLFFIIKVVPEFATWQSTEIMSHDNGFDTPTGFFNANWYQDANWQRSVRADLYKDAINGQQNTVTLGHPTGYNDDLEIDNRLTGNPGFVPMKFTYVTILGGNHAPSLINEPKVNTSSAQQGGGLLDPNLTRMLTDPSPYSNQLSSEPTENIRYDMLVRYGAHSEGGEGCFGHRLMSMNQGGKYVWGNDPRSEEQMTQFNTDRKAFDVEKFYGNICKEIYFKPGAELLRQQRLRYNRAWVEKELVPNKWYLVGSPLKDTYAGDMYVPTAMTNVATNEENVPGQQLTEAFHPINFNTVAVEATATATSQPAYSRTKYPIYQRSWNTDGSKVYTKTNDARATDYSANLVYGSVSEQLLEWSHTYNDVKVPYTTLTGFSIRADRKQHVKTDGDNQIDVPALIRLPKADTQYDYYQWDNTSPANGKLTHDVGRSITPRSSYPLPSRYANGITDNYRFVVDDPEADGLLTVDLSDLQQQDGYIMVGNPFMASLRMDEFFKGNTGLAPNYWTYNASTASAALAVPETITATGDDNADGIIRPLQAFFVKKKTELDEGETETTAIVFTRNMTIDGNYPAIRDNSYPARQLTLCAASTEGNSSALVRLSDGASSDYREGEDVETLFDSNLAGVPMVYTVAGGQAVSIDQRPQFDVVSFGVTCAASDKMVEVSLSGTGATNGNLYVVDAVTGSVTEVGEGSTFMVQPNDYGRYFLTTNGNTTVVNGTELYDIMVSVRGKQVTVKSEKPLLNVKIMTTGGVMVSEKSHCGTEVSFTVNGGVYIVDAETADGRKTVKLMVK